MSVTSTLSATVNGRVFAIVPDIRKAGRFIVADYHALKYFTPDTSEVELIAGSTLSGYLEGSGSSARFSSPYDIVFLQEDTILVSDCSNHCMRAVNLRTNQTSSYAGQCTSRGNTNGHKNSARFSNPIGLVAVGGDLFICDHSNRAIKKLSGGIVSTLLNPTGYPHYITSSGTYLYYTYRHGVARVPLAGGAPTIIAGSTSSGWTDGSLLSARFSVPLHFNFLADDLIVVADRSNNRLRLLDLSTGTTSSICSGTLGSHDGDTSNCQLYCPDSLAVYRNQLLIGQQNGRVRSLPLSPLFGEYQRL